MDIARSILHSQDMAGLGQMRQDRIVRRILAMMRIKPPKRPSHTGSGGNHAAVDIQGQSRQRLLLDRLTDDLTVESLPMLAATSG